MTDIIDSLGLMDLLYSVAITLVLAILFTILLLFVRMR